MPKRDRQPFDSSSDARRELDRLIQRNLGFRLGPYLRKLAQASVAAAVLSACGMSHNTGDAGDPTVDAGQVDAGDPTVDAGNRDAGRLMPPSAELCSTEGQWLAVHGVDGTADPTWLAALNFGGFGAPFGEIIDEVGERCGGATDPTTCNATIDDFVQMSFQRSLLTSVGDTVTKHESDEEFFGLLGTINTPNEAALAAWRAGYDIWCSPETPSSVTAVGAGYRVVAYRQSGGCGSPWITTRHVLLVAANGTVAEESSEVIREEEDWGCVGRRPAGLRAATPSRSDNPVGAFFANVTRLEASAVDAFEIMIDELGRLGAPESLVVAARDARDDEVRHTESMAAIARRYGATPGTGKVDPIANRSPFDIALENAVEGCVRETFGALVGAYQADAARDPEIKDAMRTVADDELRHAELSWALASWLEPRLSAEERARVEAAKREAIEELRREAALEHDRALIDVAGLPTPAVAVAMVDQLATDLWA